MDNAPSGKSGEIDSPKQTQYSDALAASPFGQVPIEISISVGRAHPLVADLLQLSVNSVLPLDRRIDDPVELSIGGKLIARGTLTEMDGENAGQIAVCLTEVHDLGSGF